MGQNVSQVNVRQANGIGKVHAAKPQIKETYCGRALNEEEWLITSKEVTCTGCGRAGAFNRPKESGRGRPKESGRGYWLRRDPTALLFTNCR
jgi:hypothetical protein